MDNRKYSILFPQGTEDYKVISPVTMHDLGLSDICKKLSPKEAEQNLIINIMSKMSPNPKVTKYRADIFEDILNNRQMREDMMKILGRINFLRDYGGFTREYDENSSVWDLLHRLDEIKDYIECVDALFSCLKDSGVQSEGLKGLYDYVDSIYKDNGFAELKKDIAEISFDASDLKSVTVGINLNSRFEADGIGLVSINNKYYTKSNVISNFCNHITAKDGIRDKNLDGDTDEKKLKYHQFTGAEGGSLTDELDQLVRTKISMSNPLMAATGLANVPEKDDTRNITRYMDRIVNHMLSGLVKNLKSTLNKYISVTITDMTDLIPEFMYYIRWAEYIEALKAKGYVFSKASVYTDEKANEELVSAKGIYNLKLADAGKDAMSEIVTNDLDFDKETKVYILTGANRGGKTTITQAVGQLFVMAQGGIYIPGEEFTFAPADAVYTHFPADEDKTMDLGRLGEECKRFREMYMNSTAKSLMLLNETFSTTSFEEGYFIAKDSVKAILSKGIRTIYNTHMHKLAFDVDELNSDCVTACAKSLIVESSDGKRSYKVVVAPPTGKSYARDIADKYGVTYEQLTEQ